MIVNLDINFSRYGYQSGYPFLDRWWYPPFSQPYPRMATNSRVCILASCCSGDEHIKRPARASRSTL